MGMLNVLNNRQSTVVLRREVRGAPQPELGLPKGELTIDELEFKSGANNVDEARVAEFRKSPSCERFFTDGMLQVQGAVAKADQDEPTKYGDLARLKLQAAKRSIAACNDIRQLAIWIKQDGREEIRAALIARHKELTKDAIVELTDADARAEHASGV